MIGILASLLTGIGGKILGKAAGKACDVVDQFVEDKDLAAQLKSKLTESVLQVDVTKYVAQLEAQKSVLIAEIQGDSWFQKNWRPLTMLSFVAIVLNNYIIFPYLVPFWDAAPQLDLDAHLSDQMWSCIKLGLSGYVVGRSAEKISQGAGAKGVLDKFLRGNQ